ncbi:MAG: tRNA lysidine(34) synthetase TilS, partial [Dehalococcoidia bacterium]
MPRKTIRRLVEERVRSFLEEQGLTHDPQPLVIGVSGGPDSLCLLHALHRLAEPLGLSLHVAHLNHCLRGKESDDDDVFVSELARRLGLPYTIEREEVRRRRPSHSRSLEEMAREARYEFLARVTQNIGGLGVMVAHTADDQVETVLLHLLRGTGLPGLRGMRPVSDLKTPSGSNVRLFRPLLEVARKDIVAYCRAVGITPRLDYTNLSTDYLRNKIRLKLIPTLREYNPNVESSLLRLADSASLEMNLIDKEVERVWSSTAREDQAGLRLDTAKLSQLAPALQRHLLRK